MNRLWVRFSLAFAAVIFLTGCITVSVAVISYLNRDANVPAWTWHPAGTTGTQVSEPFLTILLSTAALTLILVVVLGIALSRTLAAPLGQLATAAKRFAARDWNQRVPVQGASEIREVAEAFNQMAAELQTQETLRRNLIADIAHELRTPLTVMQGNLAAMLDQVYPLDRAEIATLFDETRWLGRLVDDLRELALADAGQLPLTLQAVDVRATLETAAAHFATVADAQGITINTLTPKDLHLVRADSDRLTQVLNNLLANAVRHTPSGGVVTLGAEAQQGFVRIFVRDNGEGISAQDLPHIFERFYRADKSRTRETGGTGLGLAIAQAWVTAMGGRIGVESAVGKGSNFWFLLPVDKQ